MTHVLSPHVGLPRRAFLLSLAGEGIASYTFKFQLLLCLWFYPASLSCVLGELSGDKQANTFFGAV